MRWYFDFFLAKQYTVGTVGTVVVPTNQFIGAAGNTNRLYKFDL